MQLKKLIHQAGAIVIWLLLLVSIVAIPDYEAHSVSSKTIYLTVIFAIFLYLVGLNVLQLVKKEENLIQDKTDLFILIGLILLGFEIFIGKLALLDPQLFPSPARVMNVFAEDYSLIFESIFSSLRLLLIGYGLAIVTAIPLGLWVGYKKRLFQAVYPLAKVASPIPPIVYIPYAIMLLPTFFMASVLVIFIGAFWPIFINTLNGVFNIDYRLLDSAKSLGVRGSRLMIKILLPGAAPSIFSGAMVGLVLSFIILTIAETIGVESGLGWYIHYFADFARYDKVLAGIITVGVVVSGLVLVFEKVQNYCLRWQRKTSLE